MHQIINKAVVQQSRGVESLVAGIAARDGAGVSLTRVISQQHQRRLDPFLLLDVFGSDNPEDYIAGFPDHPHRGFEAVSYMLAGRMRYRDSAGHEGLLQSGGVQWLTAGRGIIHSQMPDQRHGEMKGFQLWVNLPAKSKMKSAWHCDVPAEQIPSYITQHGVNVKVIAGCSDSVFGAVQREDTEPLYLDITLPAATAFDAEIPVTHNAFVYVYHGAVAINGKAVDTNRMGILNNAPDADGVRIKANGEARVILVAGRPLHEPIVQQGPFVMNSKEEISQAINDFQEGRLAEIH